MIRRLFWLTAGALAGILGYRRASAVTRQVAETLGARPENAKQPGVKRRHWARQAVRFARDVREGMDLYMSRQTGGRHPSLDATQRTVREKN